MKFNNFKLHSSCFLHNLDLTRDSGSVKNRIAKNARLTNTFDKSVINKNEEEEEEIFPIHRKKYSQLIRFLDHEIDIEISFSISRSYNFASFSSWPSSRDINHSHSHQRYVYSINIAVQSARTGLQLFGGRNLDVTLYFAELESRNSERRSSVDEQVNSHVCSLHWD